MTSDAKIGLLLALVFIVAITFVINGLPDFLNNDTQEQSEIYIKNYRPVSPGVIGNSRKVAPALNHKPNVIRTLKVESVNAPTQNTSPASTQQKIRYQTMLPKANKVVKSVSGNADKPKTTIVEVKKDIPNAQSTSGAKTANSSPVLYKVKPGDSLAKIAIKFYGPEAGNKLVNVEKIFKANQDKIKAIDSLTIGQKIVIPNLSNSGSGEILKTGLFKKVDKIAPASSVTNYTTGLYRQYLVKNDDSLWKIADKLLGNGNRYREIIELNKATINDVDCLRVGMRLKVPIK